MKNKETPVKKSGYRADDLGDSRKLFRKIVEHSPVPMAIISRDGTIELINNKLDNLFGYHRKDIPNTETWWQNAYPDEFYRNNVIADWTARIDAALKGDNEIAGKEYMVTCKNGTVKNVFISGCAVLEKLFIMFFDMSEYRNLEKALHESEQHYKMISELTTDYVFKLHIHDDGKVELNFVSDNFFSITGRDKEHSGMDFWNKIIHPDDLPKLMTELGQTLMKPQTRDFECRSFIHGNKLRWVQVFTRSEWDHEENRITSISGAVKDITERKLAEAEIIEKNKAIEAQNKEYLRLNEELLKTNRKLKEAKEKAEESNRLKTSFLQNMSH